VPAAALLLVAAVVVAVGLYWWFFIREDAKPATSAPEIPADLGPVASPTAAPPGASPAGEVALPEGVTRFVIVPERSQAAYFAGETLARIGLPSTARGTTRAITGEFYLRDTGLDTTLPSTFTVDLRGLSTDEARRDRRVQDALETDRFPTATFTILRVDGFPARLSATEDSTFTMTGLLDLHGVQKEVTWQVKARRDGDVISALATVTIRYEDFDIDRPDIAGFVSVEDDVTLQAEVIALAGRGG
jgi:polyisoprenoid-binding protein YceI